MGSPIRGRQSRPPAVAGPYLALGFPAVALAPLYLVDLPFAALPHHLWGGALGRLPLEKDQAPERARSPSHRWFRPGLARCEPQGRTAPVSVPRVSARPDLTIWSSPHSAWAPLSDLVWPCPEPCPGQRLPASVPPGALPAVPRRSPLFPVAPAGGRPVPVALRSSQAGSQRFPPAGRGSLRSSPTGRPSHGPGAVHPQQGWLPECRLAGAPTAQRTAERARHRPARKLYPTAPNVPIWSERRATR
jgi:hypothetical protein